MNRTVWRTRTLTVVPARLPGTNRQSITLRRVTSAKSRWQAASTVTDRESIRPSVPTMYPSVARPEMPRSLSSGG